MGRCCLAIWTGWCTKPRQRLTVTRILIRRFRIRKILNGRKTALSAEKAFLRKATGTKNSKIQNLKIIFSECDSGVGSNRSNKSDSDKSDNENPSKIEDEITYEQIKAQYSKSMKASKPKRSESTLSRFSSIFKSDGKKLADVMVDEFKLNDRFSGESSLRSMNSSFAGKQI